MEVGVLATLPLLAVVAVEGRVMAEQRDAPHRDAEQVQRASLCCSPSVGLFWKMDMQGALHVSYEERFGVETHQSSLNWLDCKVLWRCS